MVLAEVSHRLPFYFAGALGVMAFVISVILIRQPQNTVESHHIHFETKELSKIQWGVLLLNYLNVCTCFWFVFF